MLTGDAVFEDLRGYVFRLAYQMVGSPADAEDLVQEAWLRWNGVDQDDVESPRAWLTTVVTRLAVNHLASARIRRERYVGTWLPEPINTAASGADPVELDESLAFAFMVLLESLSPRERAVFLLHEVFGIPHREVARILGIEEANSRKLLHRARTEIRARRPRFPPSERVHRELLERFAEASRSGDVEGLAELLAEDVVVMTDGGGRARATLRPIYGRDRASRFVRGALAKFVPDEVESRIEWINGAPGLVSTVDDTVVSVITFEVGEGCIQSLFIVTNPDKLRTFGLSPD